jgi:hypothetical protein
VQGGRGDKGKKKEAMEEDMDKGNNKEAMDPIMME